MQSILASKGSRSRRHGKGFSPISTISRALRSTVIKRHQRVTGHRKKWDSNNRASSQPNLNKLFKAAADLLPAGLKYKREKLEAASAHWGRHTSITARVDSGMNTNFVQKDARHADPRTTNLYVHAEDERWHEEAQKLRLTWHEVS